MAGPQRTTRDARRTLRRLALLALSIMIASFVAAAPSGGMETVHAAQTEATPCPDPGDDGSPCGPTCPCSCCPGHAPSPALWAPRCSVGALASSELEPTPARDLGSANLLHRIFHPPRS